MEKKIQKSQNFGKEVTFKALIIVGMILLLLIPITLLKGKVRERERRKNEAVAEISQNWSRAQTVCGPVLTVPFVKQVEDKDQKGTFKEVRTLVSFAPKTLVITAGIDPESRRYGMYEAILYESAMEFEGTFMPVDGDARHDGEPDLSEARIYMAVSDMRGLKNRLVMNIAGCDYEAVSASAGMLVVKPNLNTLSEVIAFNYSMGLRGSEGLYFTPLAQTTTVALKGNWSHPSFKGDFSPEHNIDKDSHDFDAKWNVLSYNRDIPENWEGGAEKLITKLLKTNPNEIYPDLRMNYEGRFGVELVTGNDEYQQNERAVKYAILFVVLTFVVFFFVEVLTSKRIHPIQYLLVAAALIIFYTLLLPVSEVIGFGMAYLGSAVATVGLITFYTAYIFKNVRQTALLSGILAGLYAYLYFILQMENYTLLVGSVGLFAILGVVMYVSRKVNWYRSEEN